MKPTPRKPKVLFLSPQARPGGTGEEGSGFGLVEKLSPHVDATLISMTPSGLKGQLQDYLPETRVFECEKWDLPWLGERLNALVKPNYIKFYRFAYTTIHNLLASESFDIAHQVGPLALRYPSPLVHFDIPYVSGPHAGSLPTPTGLEEADSAFPWYYNLRSIDRFRFKYDPMLRRSFSKAETVVGVGSYIGDLLSDIPLKSFSTQCENAIETVHDRPEQRVDPDGVRLLYVGRVIRTKGLLYAIEALGRINCKSAWHLDVIGSGNDLDVCQKRAQELEIDHQISFHGFLNRADIDAFYERADLFVFPSFREPSGGVILEAMSFGIPLLLADYGGASAAIDGNSAILIPTGPKEDFIERIAAGLTHAIDDPPFRRTLETRTLSYARGHHTWDSRVSFYLDLYRKIQRPPQDDGDRLLHEPDSTTKESLQ